MFAFANVYSLEPADTTAAHRDSFRNLIAVLWLIGACIGSLISAISTVAWPVIPTNVSNGLFCLHFEIGT